MGVLFTNNASTTLSAAISSTSATSISVASSSTFPAPGAGEYFYATIDDGTNNEIVKVTAVSERLGPWFVGRTTLLPERFRQVIRYSCVLQLPF